MKNQNPQSLSTLQFINQEVIQTSYNAFSNLGTYDLLYWGMLSKEAHNYEGVVVCHFEHAICLYLCMRGTRL